MFRNTDQVNIHNFEMNHCQKDRHMINGLDSDRKQLYPSYSSTPTAIGMIITQVWETPNLSGMLAPTRTIL